MEIVLGLLLIAACFFLSAKVRLWKIRAKGKVSESLVYYKMLRLSDEYTIFNDLLFESNGYSTQIDHLVVSPYGVFVIETKGYKGWILGGENAEYWTQSLYGKKYQFYNPIRQNEGHVRYLRHILRGSVEIPLIPIVVFDNSADIKVRLTDHIVVNRCHLKKAIRRFCDRVISDDTIGWIVTTIHKNCVVADKKAVKNHKNNVKQRKHRSQTCIKNGICPVCGAALVRREGRYGSFYGCTNYPNCRFTTTK